jgi:hypothetical protein
MKLIYPVLFQIFWTFVVVVIMFRARKAAIDNKEVQISDIVVSGDKWPEKAKLAANNFSNQFETPMLFFVLVAIAIFVGATGWIMAWLAWIYVGTRVVHTLVHTGSNNLKPRAGVFALGFAALLAMLVGIVLTVIF